MDELRQVLTENVDYAYDYIQTHFEGVDLAKPEGTYMLFLDCEQWCKAHGKTMDELEAAGLPSAYSGSGQSVSRPLCDSDESGASPSAGGGGL